MSDHSSSPAEVALEYYRRIDTGGDVLALFAPDGELAFPKWGVARGHGEIVRMFTDIASRVARLKHFPDAAALVADGGRVALEGRTAGRLRDGSEWTTDDEAGRFCSVLEIEGGLIRRCTVYLDPDFTDADGARYPWRPSP